MFRRVICVLVVLVLIGDSADGQCTTRHCHDEIDAEVSTTELWPLKQQLAEQQESIQAMQGKLANYEKKLAKYDESRYYDITYNVA